MKSAVFRYALLSMSFFEGFLSMGLQLVANRLLSPYFGSSLYVWAFLISTFLLSFTTGAILGGVLSEKIKTNFKLIYAVALMGCLGFFLLAFFGRTLLINYEPLIDSLFVGLLIFCPLLFFLPVASLSCILPILTQFNAKRFGAGLSSGLVWGLSSLGNVSGVMLTAFVLIPLFPVSQLLLLWLVCSVLCFGVFIYMLRVLVVSGGE